jgi:hypothetical protein
MGSSFRIVLRSGPTPGKVFPLGKNELFIGRDLSNDVVINDPEISRRHTRLFLQSGTYGVEDMGSTNGTSVNGQRLTGPALLQPGDVLTLGEHVTLYYEALAAPENAAFSAGTPGSDPQAEPAYPVSYPPTYEVPQQRPSFSPLPPVVQPRPLLEQQQAGYPPQGYQPAQLPFAGQVPLAPDIEPTVRAKAPIWPFLIIGVLLLIILLLVIDDFRLWCPLFGLCG